MLTFTVKLVIALLLGVILGIERVYAHKTAGMRTYALVSVASMLFVHMVLEMSSVAWPGVVTIEPLRIVGEVAVGVGFLGGGLIIVRNNQLANVTTATAIWVSAGIGMAVGFGLYVEAVFATLATIVVLELLAVVEDKLAQRLEEKHSFHNDPQ